MDNQKNYAVPGRPILFRGFRHNEAVAFIWTGAKFPQLYPVIDDIDKIVEQVKRMD